METKKRNSLAARDLMLEVKIETKSHNIEKNIKAIEV